jgi:PAS domain S-box-containing protein
MPGASPAAAAWECDPRSNHITWNAGFEQFGYTKDEIGAHLSWWLERIHPDDRERVQQAAEKALRGDASTWSNEYRFRRRDGSWAWVVARSVIERDKKGQAVRTAGAMIDVGHLRETETRLQLFAKAEEELQETRRILLEAQRIGQVRAWQEDLRTGTVKPDLATLLGHAADPLEQVPREDAWSLIHPDDRSRVMELRRRTIEVGGPFQTEYRIVTPDGNERFIFVRGELIRDAAGKPERILGTALDITDRKRAEEALRKNERLLREAEAMGHTGSWEWDLHSNEIFSSDENRRIFFGEDRTKGFKLEDFAATYHPDDREWLREETEKLLGDGKPLGEIRFRIVWPDGSIRWILGKVLVIRSEDGKPLRAFGTNTDITERKRAEEELKRHARQQAAIAQLSVTALRVDSLKPIFDEAVALITSTLGVEYGNIMEWVPDNNAMEFRAGEGPWSADILRRVTISTAPGFMAWFYLRSKTPVVVEDLPRETRFAPCELLIEHGIKSGIAVPIAGKERPFGVLEANAKQLRSFSSDEVNFVWAMANVLATAIEQRRVAGELGDKREQLQTLSRKLIQAQEAERRAVARELHDELGQILTAIKLNLMRRDTGQDETVSLVDGAIMRVRELAQDLRPPLLDELGLEASLRWYVEREAGRAGLEARLELVKLEKRPPSAVETTCFRVAQEALTNVIRHAQARRVEVELRADGDSFQLVVRDDGIGFDVAAARRHAAQGESQGLLGMQERVALVAGKLTIESAPGRGTRVRACLPLSGAA